MIEYHNKIINGDSLSVMKEMDSESVDLIITSPPYNLGNTSGGGFPDRHGIWNASMLKNGYDSFDDNMSREDYDSWQNACLNEMFRLIKEDGAIFYNHKFRVQNGLLLKHENILKDLPVRQIIIWDRVSGINFNDTYYLPRYEVIYLICKKDFRLKRKGCHYTDVWKILPEVKNSHPAPFPIEIPNTILDSVDCEVVLDPFMGSGTVAVSCILNGKKYIGIDLSKYYIEMAKKKNKRSGVGVSKKSIILICI